MNSSEYHRIRYKTDKVYADKIRKVQRDFQRKKRKHFWPVDIPISNIRLNNGDKPIDDSCYYCNSNYIDTDKHHGGRNMKLYPVFDSNFKHIGYINYIPDKMKIVTNSQIIN